MFSFHTAITGRRFSIKSLVVLCLSIGNTVDATYLLTRDTIRRTFHEFNRILLAHPSMHSATMNYLTASRKVCRLKADRQ